MGETRRCPLFRKPDGSDLGTELYHCDLDGNATLCQADVKYCEKLETLRQFVLARLEEMERREHKAVVADI